MSNRGFYSQLGLLSLATILILFCLHLNSALRPFQNLSWFSCGFFILLSIVMYYFAAKATTSDNKNTFTNVSIGFMMVKMMFSILIILAYSKLMKPESKLFLIPFFLIYLLFTIFETYFMLKLGKDGRIT